MYTVDVAADFGFEVQPIYRKASGGAWRETYAVISILDAVCRVTGYIKQTIGSICIYPLYSV